MRFLILTALLLLVAPASALPKSNPKTEKEPAPLAARALSADRAEAAPAIAELRAQGPAGLEALLAVPAAGLDEAALARRSAAIDAVAGQRYAEQSRLYWYTDLAAAEAAAQATHRPILSLRLLGRLDEELSCANSRFFRVALYANREISDYLRTHYILHWSTERPVPVMTIDFGDGRKITRTITGNSIHYLLSEDGRPLDALPGLNGPKPFLEWLQQGVTVAGAYHYNASAKSREEVLRRYHVARLQATQAEVITRLEMAGLKVEPKRLMENKSVNQVLQAYPPAVEAAPRAVTKALVEIKLVIALTPSDVKPSAELPLSEIWDGLAKNNLQVAKMDNASIDLMRSFDPAYSQGSEGERRFTLTLARFQQSMARDSFFNEFNLHSTIHAWFALQPVQNFDELNQRVYTELFLTPASDPWLGLVQEDVFSGIANH